MKKTISFTLALLLGILLVTWYSCEQDPEETCVPDEYCNEQIVTVCCDNNDVCVYKFNGKEYTEDQLGQLASDLGCVSSSKEEDLNQEKSAFSELVEKLKAHLNRTREQAREQLAK
jgi:hypothetical protein